MALLGGANAGCEGGAASNTVIQGGNGGSDNGNAGAISALSGNNVNVPVSVPVSVRGISVALAGSMPAARADRSATPLLTRSDTAAA